MPDELTMCPFQRSIEGLRGTVLLRRNHDHVARCARAIRRRGHLPWSTNAIEFRIVPTAESGDAQPSTPNDNSGETA